MRTWDFEDGTMQGFTLENGDCGVQPLLYVGSGDDRWSLSSGGTYYVNTFLYGSDINATIGSDSKQCEFADKTHIFTITEDTEISWFATGKYNSLCLKRLSDDGELLCQRDSYAGYDMQKRQFLSSELSLLIGETFYITIADETGSIWGHLQLDNLKVVGKAESGTFHNFTFSYKMI